MAYDERLNKYRAEVYNPERMKHVVRNLRKDYPEIPGDMDDETVIRAHRKMFAPEMDDESYDAQLDRAYASGFEPSIPVPDPNLIEKAQEIIPQVPHILGEGVKAIAPFAAGQVAAQKIGSAIGTGVKAASLGRAAGVVVPALATGAKLLARQQAGESLERTAAQMPQPNVGVLKAKGYSQAQIANILNGYAQTQQSLMEDVQKTGEEGVSDAASGIAETLLFGAGANTAKDVVGRLTGSALAKAGAKGAAAQIAGQTAAHAGQGLVLGGGFGAVQGATERMAQAHAAGLGADDIWRAAVEGGFEGGRSGAAVGGILGGAIGAPAAAISTSRASSKAVSALRKAHSTALVEDAERMNLKKFSGQFRPEEMAGRFPEELAGAAGDDAALANNIVSAVWGPEVAATEHGQQAASALYDKITSWRSIRDQLSGRMVEVPQNPMPVQVEPTAGLVQGGLQVPTPEPNVIGQSMPEAGPQPFTPPEGVRPMRGIQPVGAPVPEQARPLEVQGNAPPERMPPQQVGPPLGAVETGGQLPQVPEIAPRLEGTARPAPAPREPIQLEGLTKEPGVGSFDRYLERLRAVTPTEKKPGLEAAVATGSRPAEGMRAGAAAETPMGREVELPREKVPVVKGTTPNDEVRDVSSKFNYTKGRSEPTRGEYHEINPEEARKVAVEYEKMPDTPQTPEAMERTRKSYEALNKEIEEQYKAITDSGYKLEVVESDPYKNSAEMVKDLKENKRLRVLASKEAPHQFMSKEQNDKFRAVHDFFGHGAEGYQFGARGEDNAWRKHAQMFSDDAIPALTTETRGQNSWVNFAPGNEKLAPAKRPFAKQKAGLLPEWTYADVLGSSRPVARPIRMNVLGQRISTAMEKAASDARKRLMRGGMREAFTGGPQMIADHAIVLAAEMFSRGLKTKAAVSKWLIEKWGNDIKPHINTIYEQAQSRLTKMFKTDTNANKRLGELIALRESGKLGMNWYEDTAGWVKEQFGDDSDMFLRFLAATSANSSTEAGATLAMKAYGQWKMGLPFDGMRSHNMVKMLEDAVEGKVFGGDKVQNFYRALAGDKDAVVLDRWMIRALGLPIKKGSLGDNDYKLYSQIVKNLAEDAGMSTRQFQAAIWEGARIGDLQTRWKTGGPKAASKVGSARPLEALLKKEFGGNTPYEWVRGNKMDLETLKDMTEGIKTARKEGGYSFTPNTWEKDTQPGYVLPLVSEVIPKKEFYPGALTKFKRRVANLISEAAMQGKHITIGAFDMGSYRPGHYSIDLNVVIPNTGPEALAKAKEVGKLARQFEIGEIGEGGVYVQGHKTGYNPKKQGPQFLPPEGEGRGEWFREAHGRARDLLDQVEFTLTPPKGRKKNG